MLQAIGQLRHLDEQVKAFDERIKALAESVKASEKILTKMVLDVIGNMKRLDKIDNEIVLLHNDGLGFDSHKEFDTSTSDAVMRGGHLRGAREPPTGWQKTIYEENKSDPQSLPTHMEMMSDTLRKIHVRLGRIDEEIDRIRNHGHRFDSSK
tara:strand:+ start:217 stop:672 length:456 start_codon:yes stop_codon:yes gene_type:complete